MLGGRALSRPDIFQFGLDVLEGCWHAYNVTATGVGPERTTPSQKFLRQVWQWKSNDTDDQPYTQISRQELEKYGIWSIERGYYLRPGPPSSFETNFCRNHRIPLLRLSSNRKQSLPRPRLDRIRTY